VRKAAATKRQTPRAERAIGKEGADNALSFASDDEVGGFQSAIRAERAWRARQLDTVAETVTESEDGVSCIEGDV
jgi:hypothetical protein